MFQNICFKCRIIKYNSEKIFNCKWISNHTWLARNRIFSVHNLSWPKDFQALYLDAWFWQNEGTWLLLISGRGKLWCDLNLNVVAKQWFCGDRIASVLWSGKSPGKSPHGEAKKDIKKLETMLWQNTYFIVFSNRSYLLNITFNYLQNVKAG